VSAARKLRRKLTRQENGDLSVLRAPLDLTLRRLSRKVARAHATRKAAKQ